MNTIAAPQCEFRDAIYDAGEYRYECIHCAEVVKSPLLVSPGQVHRICAVAIPGIATTATNFVRSLSAFVASDMRTVARDEREARLAICKECHQKKGAICRHCGCVVAAKAWGLVWDCPVGKWPKLSLSKGKPVKGKKLDSSDDWLQKGLTRKDEDV